MRWSMGKGKYGQVEEILEGSWDELTELLRESSAVPLDPADKEHDWWVMPAVIKPAMIGKHRREEDIVAMANWLGLDVDDGNKALCELRVTVGPDAPMIAYTTASSTSLEQRWRVLLQTDRPMEPGEYRRCWKYMARRFGVDMQTSNCSRIYYVPRAFSEESVFYAQRGSPLKVDAILALSPEPTQFSSSGVSNGMLRMAPTGSDVITSSMLNSVAGAPEGGRLIRLMSMAAKRYRCNGWHLSSSDLEEAALEASSIISPGKKRPGLGREADRAIQWAEAHFEPESPLERMRNRILWERSKRS